MSDARKLLAAMVADRDPRGYSYDDAARVLTLLGFSPARTKPQGSHRLWRLEVATAAGKESFYVGLVDKGHGTLKPVYIKKMISTLVAAGLVDRGEG